MRESGFADGRSKTSPDSEQIERGARMCNKRNSASMEQIQERENLLNEHSEFSKLGEGYKFLLAKKFLFMFCIFQKEKTMQVNKISFTSEQPQKKESALYSKKGFMTVLTASRFTGGMLGGFAALECIDKFVLVNNLEGLSSQKLWKKAKNHTKWNILGGIATGILAIFIGKIMDKKLIPWNERLWDNAEKQEAINKKAKELVEQEKTQKTEKPVETPKPEEKEVPEEK